MNALPCPFDSTKPYIGNDDSDYTMSYKLWCPHCEWGGMMWRTSSQDAVEDWNAQVSKIHTRIARLRTALSRAGIVLQSLQNTLDSRLLFGMSGDERKAIAYIQAEIKKALEETK